jgi:hypothetical protein
MQNLAPGRLARRATTSFRERRDGDLGVPTAGGLRPPHCPRLAEASPGTGDRGRNREDPSTSLLDRGGRKCLHDADRLQVHREKAARRIGGGVGRPLRRSSFRADGVLSTPRPRAIAHAGVSFEALSRARTRRTAPPPMAVATFTRLCRSSTYLARLNAAWPCPARIARDRGLDLDVKPCPGPAAALHRFQGRTDDPIAEQRPAHRPPSKPSAASGPSGRVFPLGARGIELPMITRGIETPRTLASASIARADELTTVPRRGWRSGRVSRSLASARRRRRRRHGRLVKRLTSTSNRAGSARPRAYGAWS